MSLVIIAIDPGDKYNGFAIYRNDEGKKWKKVKIGIRESKEEIYSLLRTLLPDRVICEDFRLHPFARRPAGFSKLDTSRMVGAIEYFCNEKGIPLTMQTTGNRDIGYKYGSIEKLPHSDPRNHAHDADAHAHFWIINHGGLIESG